MSTDPSGRDVPSGDARPATEERKRALPPAAKRALAEAEARRKAMNPASSGPREIGGPSGPEPVRYGDWEVKGRASDF